MSDHDAIFQSIKGMVESLQLLNQQAVAAYAPIVEEIVRTRSRDINHIEHTLDALLDLCAFEPALVPFKRLCRYYWDINPAATASYIDGYRVLWDSDSEPPQEDEATAEKRGDA